MTIKWEWGPYFKYFNSCDEYLHRVYVVPLGIGRVRVFSKHYCGVCLGWYLDLAGEKSDPYYRAVIRCIKMHSKGIYLTRKKK